MRDQIAALDREHAHLADREFDPVQRQLRQQADECLFALADFHDQPALLGQMLRRRRQDTQREIQAVLACFQA